MQKTAQRKKTVKESWGEDQFILADRYMEQKQFKRAFNILRAAADGGESRCYLNLGYCYDIGLGCKRDWQKALYWYKRAVRRGSSSAAINIGITYRNQRKRYLALYWFKKSLAMGDGDALLELGKLMLNAYGDKTQAKHYFRATIKRKTCITEFSQEEAAEYLAKL